MVAWNPEPDDVLAELRRELERLAVGDSSLLIDPLSTWLPV
jgi:hypothetical protein